MESPKNKKGLTFENALFLALSANDMLLPTNDEQVSEFESRVGTLQTIPNEFSKAEDFIPNDNVRALESYRQDNFDIYNLKVASSDDEKTEGNDDGDKDKE